LIVTRPPRRLVRCGGRAALRTGGVGLLGAAVVAAGGTLAGLLTAFSLIERAELSQHEDQSDD
jgi:hypothetical protein